MADVTCNQYDTLHYNLPKNSMNFKNLLALIGVAIGLSVVPAMAQDAAWQNSYALEAAGKYTEAIAAIDSVSVNGPEAELKLIRRGWLFYLPGRFDE